MSCWQWTWENSMITSFFLFIETLERVDKLQILCCRVIGKSKCWHIFLKMIYLKMRDFCFFSIICSVQCCKFMRENLPVALRVRQSDITRRFVKGKEILMSIFPIYCLCFNISNKAWWFMFSVLISVEDLLGKLLRLVQG